MTMLYWCNSFVTFCLMADRIEDRYGSCVVISWCGGIIIFNRLVPNNNFCDMIKHIQACLNFEGIKSCQFDTSKGLGRVGVGGFLLGVLFGISCTALSFCSLLVFVLDKPWGILYALVCSIFKHLY